MMGWARLYCQAYDNLLHLAIGGASAFVGFVGDRTPVAARV